MQRLEIWRLHYAFCCQNCRFAKSDLFKNCLQDRHCCSERWVILNETRCNQQQFSLSVHLPAGNHNGDSTMKINALSTNSVMGWLFAVDRILRGESIPQIADVDRDIKFPVVGVSLIVIAMAVVYGFCMGVFSLIHGAESSEYSRALLQTFASMTKVPMLYCLTLLITFPSLYVFNALVGSRLKVTPVFKLLVASLAVNLAVLVSLGPILAFFSASTPNYSFIILLNVGIFTIAGILGLMFLVQALNRLANSTAQKISQTSPPNAAELSSSTSRLAAKRNPAAKKPLVDFTDKSPPREAVLVPSAIESPTNTQLGRHVKKVFACWVIVFGLVGAQMGWVLRPFIGSPDLPFQFFRARESNFFEAVFGAFWNMFS